MQILIWDIETLLEMFLVVIYDPSKRKYIEFEVSRQKYQLDALIRFIEQHADYYWVGYNNIRFDSQVVEWIIRNHESWGELGGMEICAKIALKAHDVIDDANYDIFPEYRESDLSFKQIDLFKLNHYDNRNRMVSLKRLEFEMDLENIEEMPIHHTKVDMTNEELEMTRHYCKNDVMATYEFYKVTIGKTSHPLYKDNNQIQLRLDIEEEFGIPCLNYSDSKIGDEMIKKFYCEEKRINYSELPRKGMFRADIPIRVCIAPYVTFQTKQLKDFHKDVRKQYLKQKDDFIRNIDFYGQKYTFAKGGLHSVNKPMTFVADDDYYIIDWDASSFYPATIINNGKYPGHLGKEFLKGYIKMFERRLELKPFAKKDKRIAGIVAALKLAVNSVYGKSSDMQSWIYDRQLTMFTTITGELSLMMLIEAYELAGINVISANTDGVTIRIHKNMLAKMEEINAWWMELTKYELERTDYLKIVFSTVNDYIAVKKDGEIKKKGDFLTDFELHKNKSARVVPIALAAFFIDGVPIEQTIKNHKNIYDFAIRQKASRFFHYEGMKRGTPPIISTKTELIENGWQEWIGGTWIKTEWITNRQPYDRMATSFEHAIASVNADLRYKHSEKSVYNKLIRYYISYSGEKLLKIKNPECETNAVAVSQVDAGDWVATVCNKLKPDHPLDNVNRNYYIDKANRIALNILYEGRKHKVESSNQLSLF